MKTTTLREFLEGDQPIAAVVQGGGMRGIYSIAALAALETAGYSERFGDLYGTSAGALNSAYFVARQARAGIDIYREHLITSRFINPRRARRIIDIDYLIDEVLTHDIPLDLKAVERSPSRLHVGVTSATTGRLDWFDIKSTSPIAEIFRATTALPIVYGREVAIAGERYVDGGLAASIPIQRAIADGYRNVLVILTRPKIYIPPAPSKLVTAAIRIAARAQGHSAAVVKLLLNRTAHLGLDLDPTTGKRTGAAAMRIWVIAPSGEIAGRLTTRHTILDQTATRGRSDALRVLDSAESFGSISAY